MFIKFYRLDLLLGKSNDTTGQSATSMPSGPAVFKASLPKIIFISMHLKQTNQDQLRYI